jgi:predicted naringenin-chalcone synthase
MQSVITALGIANPPYQRPQTEIAELLAQGFHLTPEQAKLVKRIYQSSGIETRYSVLRDYLAKPGEFEFFPNTPELPFPSTAQRMALYKAHALGLALAAIANALIQRPEIAPDQITHLITVSCTGMYAPGIDIEIVQELGLNTSVKRSAVNFMGCYGAFNGMKLANSICMADAQAVVLVVCVELCSLHVQKEFNMNNIVSNALFADGAAAVLIQPPQSAVSGLQFQAFHCDLIPQTSSEMAWCIADSGFDMVLTAYVPEAIRLGIAEFMQRLLAVNRQSMQEVSLYAIHPGGLKILSACEEALGITPEDNRFAYQVLRQYGNMSSPTVLFVLKALQASLTKGDMGKSIFSCAFGPGLTLESMLLTVLG